MDSNKTGFLTCNALGKEKLNDRFVLALIMVFSLSWFLG
jgi:hypothetical protein